MGNVDLRGFYSRAIGLVTAGMMSVFLVACAGGGYLVGTVCKLEEVSAFKVTERSRDPIVLNVSGLAFNSSATVRKIEVVESGNIAVIKVYLQLAKPGKTGRFDYAYTVPAHILQVSFENENTVIWKRTRG